MYTKNFWKRLIETEKECNFKKISAEELLVSTFMTAITDKKQQDKIMRKNSGAEKKNDLMKHMRKEESKEQNTGSTNFGK